MAKIKLDPGSEIDSRLLNRLLDENYNTITKAMDYNEYIRNRQKILETFITGLDVTTVITSTLETSGVATTGGVYHLDTENSYNLIDFTTNAYGEKIPVGTIIKDSDGNTLCDKPYQPWTILSPDAIWCVDTTEYTETNTLRIEAPLGPVTQANLILLELLPVGSDVDLTVYNSNDVAEITAAGVTGLSMHKDLINFGGYLTIANNAADYIGIKHLYLYRNTYSTDAGYILYRNTGLSEISGLDTVAECDSDQIQIELYESSSDALTLDDLSEATATLLYDSDDLGYGASISFSPALSPTSTNYIYTKVTLKNNGESSASPLFKSVDIS